jgi:glycosyltransferase involved in cell wall biosynthesis
MALILMAAYTDYRRDPRVKREAEALVERGHQVVFLAQRQPGQPDRETIAGVDVIKMPSVGNDGRSKLGYVLDYALFFGWIVLHTLRHPLRYDIVHVNNMPDFHVLAAFVPRLLGRPVIHDVHDLMPELYAEKFGSDDRRVAIRLLKVQERWAGRFASAVLTVEARLKDILAARGIPAGKIHVLMNLPDDRIFRPRAPRAPRAPDAPFVLVYHGTLAHRLGLDIALEAVARARAEVPGLRLRIIGDGEERTPLGELRDRLGLQEVVEIHPPVPVERIPSMIEDADVGLVPLRISGGTDIMLPTKLLEYVNVGIPCITPRTGTIGRYFDDKMVEFFQAENVDALATAIVRLARDPARCASLAQQATERFGTTYRWSVHKKVYTDLVERLLGERARARASNHGP